MAGLCSLNRAYLRKILPVINRRLVSTSKKNNDTVAAEVCDTAAKTAVDKNWVSYGFNHKTKEGDRNAMHSIFFVSVTLSIAVFGFVLAYLPDFGLKDWSQREAFIQLRHREKNGLPLVDPNLINPKLIVLPSDEELGNTEIII
ncbi:unnamed protein product [Brassicogethes aeneus]|uniref:NADH dehydrogenase [ubiquinone] 1 beta subcomplex subunit 11, mitochondrial n=1 Tax=Brassicogethes aeneus TaxID=1431903 RepID=A0A9P0FIH6_BRAAE|nr:unnamed protein product [Brassicogethes aeneus]